LYQLLDDNVSIFNLFSRKELTKRWLWEEKGLTAEQHKLSKIIQGDKSDNINGIEGIGEKRGDDLAKTYKTIGNLLKQLPIAGKSKYIKNLNSGVEILKRNEQLINLTENVRNIITYGSKGDEHLRILEEFSTKIMESYPEVPIQPVILTGEMTTTHLNKLESMVK
jgi:5'-3' exonuclease